MTAPIDHLAAGLREQSAGCRLSFSWMGTRKTLSREQKEEAAETFGADGKAISASKRLLDTKHPAWKAVTAIKGRLRQYWESTTLPYPDAGVRLIRRKDIEAFTRTMEQGKLDLTAAVAELEGLYGELRAKARGTLGTLFNESDYPERLEGNFSIEWEFPNLTPPDYLREINPELYAQEQARIEARFNDAIRLAEEAFAAEFSGMVTHLANVLTDDPTEGKKTFRDSAVTNLREFFDRFRSLSVRSNAQLDELVNSAQSLLANTAPADLRRNPDMRASMAADMARISAKIEEQVVTAPRRKIMLPGMGQAQASAAAPEESLSPSPSLFPSLAA